MNTLKTLCTVIVLSAVGYGVYATLYGKPDGDPPAEAITPGWDTAPKVQMPQMSSSSPTTMGQGGAAPKFVSAAPATEANPFPTPTDNRYPTADANMAASVSPPFVPSNVNLPTGSGDAMSPYPSTQTPQESVYNRVGSQGDGARTVSLQVPIGGNNPAPNDFAAAKQAAMSLLQQGKLDDGLKALSAWYDRPEVSATDKQDLQGLLDRLAGTVIYSRQHLVTSAYQTQPGDTLERIAEAYQVPWQLLAKINGIQDPQRLRPGEPLKVLRGPFHAVVSLQRYELTLYLEDRYAGKFKIGIGKDHTTPLGNFTVLDKVKNPSYYGPDGKVMSAGDPQNPLGGYWIDLGDKIGIHGTIDPQSIGREDSRGCIRLSPRDIDDVFDILSKGSVVYIRS